eukprot:353072-Chlamydomonas_euryale.AAC.7
MEVREGSSRRAATQWRCYCLKRSTCTGTCAVSGANVRKPAHAPPFKRDRACLSGPDGTVRWEPTDCNFSIAPTSSKGRGHTQDPHGNIKCTRNCTRGCTWNCTRSAPGTQCARCIPPASANPAEAEDASLAYHRKECCTRKLYDLGMSQKGGGVWSIHMSSIRICGTRGDTGRHGATGLRLRIAANNSSANDLCLWHTPSLESPNPYPKT